MRAHRLLYLEQLATDVRLAFIGFFKDRIRKENRAEEKVRMIS